MNPRARVVLRKALLVMGSLALVAPGVGDAAMRFTIDSGGGSVTSPVAAFATSGTGWGLYNFTVNAEDNPVATPPFPLFEQNAVVFLHRSSSSETIAVGMIFERPNQSVPPPGGSALTTVAGLPVQSPVINIDDEFDAYTHEPLLGTVVFDLEWASCCTDGFVVDGLPESDWTIQVAMAPGTVTGVTSWTFLTGEITTPNRIDLGALSNTLRITAEQTCGNGNLDGDVGEQCDDGNRDAVDGCSASCVVEGGWTCANVPSVCTPICGDGLLRGAEQCDDGNSASGDCCSASCGVEADCECLSEPSICHRCGDGVVGGNEQCDLGVPGGSSGNCPVAATCDTCTRSCSSGCRLFGQCTDAQICCTSAAECGPSAGCCGNGIVEVGEVCDDGNRVGGDTCTPTCQADTGLPVTCCPRGGELAGATVLARKKVKLTRLGAPAGDDQLKSVGEAVLLPGQDIHPCTEGVSYCLEDADGIVYGPNPIDGDNPQVDGSQIATCVDTSSPRRVRAKYTDRGRPPIGSDPDGLKQLDLKNVASQPNKYKYKVLLRDVNLTTASPPAVLRQSLVIGDTCLVLKLVCTPVGTSTALCVPSL